MARAAAGSVAQLFAAQHPEEPAPAAETPTEAAQAGREGGTQKEGLAKISRTLFSLNFEPPN